MRVSLFRTLTSSAGTVVLSFVTGLFVALLLNRTTVLRGLARTLLNHPLGHALAGGDADLVRDVQPAVRANQRDAQSARRPRGRAFPGLYSSETAMLAIVVATSWRLFPAVTLILLAGLQGIPPEQYEAAEVDGASAWARFRYITMPGIRTVSITMITLLTIWSSKLFTIAWTLTQGGPGDATRVLSV